MKSFKHTMLFAVFAMMAAVCGTSFAATGVDSPAFTAQVAVQPQAALPAAVDMISAAAVAVVPADAPIRSSYSLAERTSLTSYTSMVNGLKAKVQGTARHDLAATRAILRMDTC